jgi:type III restriction enzyme
VFSLIDKPNEPGFPPLPAMAARWPRKRDRGHGHAARLGASATEGQAALGRALPSAALVVARISPSGGCKCCGLITKEVTYFDEFDLVPSQLRPFINAGEVLVTNWHQFAPNPSQRRRQSYVVGGQGREAWMLCQKDSGNSMTGSDHGA